MYIAVMGLVTCVGAWFAWRRHPLYSARSTFRIAGETLLLVAASVFVIAATVHLIEGRSVTVQLGTLLGVIIALTIAMILTITAIATPKSAKLNTQLPPSTVVVSLHRRPVTHWLKIAAAFLALCALLCLIPGPIRYIVGSVAAIGALLACTMLPVAYIMARKLDRAVTALELRPWIHWHYSEDVWQAWSNARVERLKEESATFVLKRDWRRFAWVWASVIAAALIATPGGLLVRVSWALGGCVLIFSFTELAAWDVRRAPEKLRARLHNTPPDVYFGQDGLVCDGRFLTWLEGVYLKAVSIDTREPRSLLFEFEKIMPNPYGPSQVIHLQQSVLIPSNASNADLSQLKTALVTRCPSARIALS
jgi:hypothetical protein